jgi:hypothetical protein
MICPAENLCFIPLQNFGSREMMHAYNIYDGLDVAMWLGGVVLFVSVIRWLWKK